MDAGLMVGVGVSLFGLGVAVHLGVDGWIRLKRLERESQPPPAPPPDVAAASALAARLERIEQIVEVTAVEVERVAEAQRFLARTLAEQGAPRLPEPRAPGRVVTPH